MIAKDKINRVKKSALKNIEFRLSKMMISGRNISLLTPNMYMSYLS